MLSPIEAAAEREAVAARLSAERGVPIAQARRFMDSALAAHQRGADLIAACDRFPSSVIWSQVLLWRCPR